MLKPVIKDASITLRVPADLKADVQGIADATDRSLSNAVLWLVRRGVEAYKADGILAEGRKEPPKPNVTSLVEGFKPKKTPPLGSGIVNDEKKRQGRR